MWVEKGWEWKFKWRRHLFDRELEMADCFRNDVVGSCIQIHKKDDWRTLTRTFPSPTAIGHLT